SSRRRHTSSKRDWSSDVCSSDLRAAPVVDAASKVLSDTANKVGNAARDFQGKLQDDYIPPAAGQLAPAAGRSADVIKDAEIPACVNDTITRLPGNKSAGRKLNKAASTRAKDAEKQLKKQSKKKQKSRRGLLVVGITVATAGAAYAIWRLSQPVEDPWTNPTPQPLTTNEK